MNSINEIDVAGGTEVLFMDALKAFVIAALDGRKAPILTRTGKEDGELVPWTVFDGWEPLPSSERGPGAAATNTEKPMVLISPTGGKTSGFNDIGVHIEVRSASRAEGGYRYTMAAIVAIRNALQEVVNLDSRYMVNKDSFEWTMFDEQPYPLWCGYLRARFTLPTIQQTQVRNY